MTQPIIIEVNDSFQTGYRYALTAPMGAVQDSRFAPHYTPKEMLKMGVFEGKYINDCRAEFPADWYEDARLSDHPDILCNYFKLLSRQPLAVWRERGWICGPDPRGWFQWYCRYYMGRRLPEIDLWQIKRWRAFARHQAQVRKNCMAGDLTCRPRQRQALLQWAYDALI